MALYSSTSSRRLPALERRELARRRLALLLYLWRSPLYDAATKRVVLGALAAARDNVPLLGRLAAVAMEYVPHYRGIYTYLWTK